jgi:cysteine-rich repeat protein
MRPARLCVCAAAALLGLSAAAQAGGPLVTTTNGVAVGWDTAAPLRYFTDRGRLGYLTNDDAVAVVGTLFETWAAVPSATIAFERAGATDVDIDGTNFGSFLGPYGGATRPLGMNVIVFDADGSIFDQLYGVGTAVLGFASPTFLSDGTTTVPIGEAVPPGAKIVEGIAFLNGKWIDGTSDPARGNYELSLDTFEAVFVHEFGHFAGLDHTQIHGLALPPDADVPGVTEPVETMYPFLFGAAQKTLERDDTVALSVLYPRASFAATTGRITGRVLTSAGVPFSGANVIARNINDDSDAVSYVSGATLVSPGTFTLDGLTPGASYRVEVQAVDAANTGGSRVGPFSPPMTMPGPPEAYNGAAESADPSIDDPSAGTPIVAAAGVTTGGVDIVLNHQSFAVTNVPLEDESQLRSFAFGDFDSDGIVDFVAPQWGFVPGNLTRLYRGVGGGAFAPPVTIDAFPGGDAAVAGQLNRGVDSFLDVAVVSGLRKEIRVYFGNGSGGFAPPMTVLDLPDDFSRYVLDLVTGDLNGDGWADLLTVVVDGPSDTASAYALLGSASGSFTIVQSDFPSGSGFPRSRLRLAPIAGNVALDVIGKASSTALGLLTGDGTGAFTASLIPLSSVTQALGSGFAVGDFNADGRADVAISDLHPTGGPPNYTRSFIDVLLGDGNGGFTLSARYAVPEPFQDSIVATDIDRDGHVDIASTTSPPRGYPGARVHLALGDGTGGVGALQSIWGMENPLFLAAAELDGDGRMDLVLSGGIFPFGGGAHAFYSVLLSEDCGNGVVESFEQCDDGNRTSGDGCDANCTPTACGNGIVTAGEECDDGNTLADDCCSPTCQSKEPAGTPCAPDPDPCSRNVCDAVGICRNLRQPRTGCRAAGTSRLFLDDEPDHSRDTLVWKWLHGEATSAGEFGDPTSTTGYGLCVYEGASGSFVTGVAVPADGVKWTATPRGFAYHDAAGSADGVRSIRLSGGTARAAKAVVRAGGASLPHMWLGSLGAPLTAQLINTDDATCWGGVYENFEAIGSSDGADRVKARTRRP